MYIFLSFKINKMHFNNLYTIDIKTEDMSFLNFVR
jgi:hypothetical protein